MEDKEKSRTESNSEPKENSITTKMVLLVKRPDGSAFVKSFTRTTDLPSTVVLKDSEPVSIKEFDSLPKRMAFFFEKGF